MEPEGVKIERRGRKRKRNDVQSTHMGSNSKEAVPSRSIVLIGRYMTKEFEVNSVFIGKVVSYDRGLYRVDFENGDCEELDSGEVKAFLVEEEDMDDDFYERKKNLDEYVLNKYAKDETVQSASIANPVETIGHTVELVNLADKVESLSNGGVNEVCEAQIEVDSDSCSDLSDYELSSGPAEAEHITIPPPQLPLSSGNIGISEEHVSHLLSVYSFLRSFSVCLFLSPFGLDEFVGALNSSVHNTLMDAIHVALMRALKSRLEMLSSEGLEVASKCLRSTDWSLLDSLTWPVYAVQYLMIMRYTEGPEWKEFYINVLEKEYYALSAGRKLIILQLLCDDALDSTEIRAEIDTREESEVGSDPDGVTESTDESLPRRFHLKYPKTSVKNDSESHMTTLPSGANSLSFNTGPNTSAASRGDEDGNGDECRLCGMDGTLLCCDGCPSAYHSRCIGVSKLSIPKGAWYCLECTINRIGPNVTRLTSLRGAVFFGVDPYDQVFLGTCDHLLVMKTSGSLEQCFRYYAPNDIQKVLCALNYSVESTTVYSEICKGILQYWEIPEDTSPLTQSVGLDKEGSNAPELFHTKNVLSGVTVINSEDTTASCPQENCSKLFKVVNQLSGSSFKRQMYLNLYTQGDFAASCAASLAILSSERASEPQSSSSHRKSMSANYSLQIKAFSLPAKRFYWPNSERKLVEVPREKCGWCLSCKVNGKRGCLLNASALNAIKGAAKTLASLCSSKNVDGGLASIATYVMFMEESLCGLTVGRFRSLTYRERWRKQVEEAATLSAIKASLLEFERSIRSIAFSADWAKLVDDMGLENPVPQSTSSVVGSTQKHGPGRRRGRKPSRITEAATADSEDESTGFAWWRGGMLSKCVFHKGILPQSIIKNTARQGGCGKIDGVHYIEGFEVPKRSRQFVWRAAVETSKTVSQLALQVRHLDDHVRWNDLVLPEQPPQDGKGAETEASAFRNACIVDKKVVEDKTSYGIVFENQKHLPSRVLKNILEVEKGGDGTEKYWLIETHIPLYLITEYEKKAEELIMPSTDDHVNTLSYLQRKLLKASGKNIFSFLSKKRDSDLGKCLCISCQLDISFRNAATCSACQGYCHEQCTVISTIRMNEHVNFSITCKQCHHKNTINARNENMANSPTSPLLLQGQKGQSAVTAINGGNQNGYRVPFESLNQSSMKKLTINHPKVNKNGKQKIGTLAKSSKMKQKSRSKLPLGLRWRKKNSEDTGIDFRLKNIILKNNPNRHLLAPLCYICMKPYNPDLMYIRCETCNKWCHAEALELKESKILDLVGFKCCKCRRMRSPFCPYMDPEIVKKILEKNPHLRAQTQTNLGSDSNSEINYEPVNIQELDSINIQENNSHLLSPPMVDQANVHNTEVDLEYGLGPVSGSGAQKLPFRRHNDLDTGPDLDVSMDGFEGNMMLDYEGLNCEDMEFEPQTYFSFKELLESDDGEVNPSENLTGNWDNNSSAAALNISYDQQEPMFSVESGADMVSCGVCSKTEPCPDLFCQICSLSIHNYCSPWDEETGNTEGGWKCGHCRDWRQ